MKDWLHETNLYKDELTEELNDLSKRGYKIFKLWRVVGDEHDTYEIVAFKEGV